MSRKLHKTKRLVSSGLLTDEEAQALVTAADVADWLGKRAFADDLWLLAHAEDGVVWGRWHKKQAPPARQLTTSDQVFGALTPGSLHPDGLQRCRLFGPTGELLLWRAGSSWRWRLYQDEALDGTEIETIEESYLLWGTHVEDRQQGFALLADGVQGLRHAVPRDDVTDVMFAAQSRPLRLNVRHYLGRDREDGTVTIVASRLVDLTVAGGG